MLDRLDRNRLVQQELAASTRAALAQQELVDAIPIPLVVTSIPNHDVLHANQPAQTWLDGGNADPWITGLDSSVRSRLFQQLADRGVVDEFEVSWRGATGTSWAVLSARRLNYLGHDAVLTAFAPINHLKLMEQRLELWAKVFEASSESIMIMDGAHHLLSVNRAFRRSTGYDFHEVVGEKPEFLQFERAVRRQHRGAVEHRRRARRVAGRDLDPAPDRRRVSRVAGAVRRARRAGHRLALHRHLDRHHRPQEERGAHPLTSRTTTC